MSFIFQFSYFSLLYQSFNRPIMKDCSHFATQPLIPSEPYRLKLNLTNWPDKRDWANWEAERREIVRGSSCILMLLEPRLLLMPVLSSFGQLFWVEKTTLIKQEQIYTAYIHMGCLTLFCQRKSAKIFVSNCHITPTPQCAFLYHWTTVTFVALTSKE